MPKRKPKPVCERTGKVIFRSFSHAVRGLPYILRTFGTARIYFDHECKHWHITKQEKK